MNRLRNLSVRRQAGHLISARQPLRRLLMINVSNLGSIVGGYYREKHLTLKQELFSLFCFAVGKWDEHRRALFNFPGSRQVGRFFITVRATFGARWLFFFSLPGFDIDFLIGTSLPSLVICGTPWNQVIAKLVFDVRTFLRRKHPNFSLISDSAPGGNKLPSCDRRVNLRFRKKKGHTAKLSRVGLDELAPCSTFEGKVLI